MTDSYFTILLGCSVLLGVVLGIILVAYEDGVAFGLYRRIKCNMGKHTWNLGRKGCVRKYYCVRCKKPRSHPSLTVVQGGKKEWDIGSFKL